eukprot:gnl/Dysnectes_brevis/2464_a2942_1020.p1 GENE.gnl/Dysnectes_brevis/2464_a2942_1020~~gnl/Dysnectes_brevis/2464_a2942_1020.p1  ORF type:complete len:354 (+),score=61.04 gnl/Dysnectes_brevis/2464_a2942_1020:160-1221(+)
MDCSNVVTHFNHHVYRQLPFSDRSLGYTFATSPSPFERVYSLTMQFVDIGANLTDPVFKGIYRGRQIHDDDFSLILKRAKATGVKKCLITVGSFSDVDPAVLLCRTHPDLFAMTLGIHPTRSGELEKPGARARLTRLVRTLTGPEGPVVALGEVGLDYDRLRFCDRDTQLRQFKWQLDLAKSTGLPLFLHCRAATEDFVRICREVYPEGLRGVAHCFTGDKGELAALLGLGLHIGVTGCSLKTPLNISCASTIPLDRLHLETDCPWCEIRNSHAGSGHVRTRWPMKRKEKYPVTEDTLVKGRFEPCNIIQVLEVVAAIISLPDEDLEMSREEKERIVAAAAYKNSIDMFFSSK